MLSGPLPRLPPIIWWLASLTPDLYRLAQGAVAPWGLEYQLDLHRAPEDNVPNTQSSNLLLLLCQFWFDGQSNLAAIIPSSEPYFKIQIFIFAQGTIMAAPFTIGAVAKLIFIVLAGVVRPQEQPIGILPPPEIIAGWTVVSYRTEATLGRFWR